MTRPWAPGIDLLLASLLCACGSGWTVTYAPPTPPPPPVIAVSVTPGAVSVTGLKSQLFTAQVTGTTNTAVTWSVSGSGCSGAACGVIASNGVYTAPGQVPNPPIVTVTATSGADNSKTGMATATVLPTLPVTVSIIPKSATVLDGKTVHFSALVSNTQNAAVTWTVTGAGCAGAGCGSISDLGIYTAPATAPVPGTMMVTAVSQADPAKTDQAFVTVVDSPGGLITGTHTYLLSGFNAAEGVAAVGSITFQSGGTFIASEDGAFSSGANNPGTWNGTYSVGGDGRGTITGSGLNIGTRVFQISVLPSDEIRFVQFNTAGQRASGIMRRANATGLPLAGDWAFETSGVDFSGGSMGMIGHLQFDAAGSITGSYVLQDYPTMTQGQLTGNYTPPLAGRSDVQLLGLGRTLNWALYVVNDNELFFITNGSRDPMITQLAGRLLRRSGTPFAAGSLDASTVLWLRGVTWVSAGQFAFDGAISASGTLDVKPDMGGVTQNAPATAEYGVDMDGCGTLTIRFPGDAPQFNMCMISPNQAFVLQSTGSTDAQAFAGEINPQIGPVSDTLLDGTYNFGSEFPTSSSVGLAAGVLVNSAGALSGTADISLPSGDTAGQVLSGSILSFDPATGRGTATLPDIPGMASAVFYVTSNGQLVLLPVSQLTPGTDGVESVIKLGR